MSVKQLLADRLGLQQSGSSLFRRRRFEMFLELMDSVLRGQETCRILDLGGEARYWRVLADLLGNRRFHVTMINPVFDRTSNPPIETGDDLARDRLDAAQYASVAGDACNMSGWSDMSFDIVHSNSVIEHVGQWQHMVRMAAEVRRLAPAYFVQTPDFWFPIEPHSSTAFFHWLPESVRVSMLMQRSRGNWGRAPDVQTAMSQIHSAVLLDRRMMSSLFPDADLRLERVGGMIKSLVAIRQAPQSGSTPATALLHARAHAMVAA